VLGPVGDTNGKLLHNDVPEPVIGETDADAINVVCVSVTSEYDDVEDLDANEEDNIP
jgi:hypothetical protein